jgi:hypothetical protein
VLSGKEKKTKKLLTNPAIYGLMATKDGERNPPTGERRERH